MHLSQNCIMSNIRIGIIGAGNIAFEHLKVIQDLNDVSVVGITSRTLTKAQNLAEKFEIDTVYDSVDDLLEGCTLDGIMVLVSANEIYNVTSMLLPIRIPVFLEKPPGLTPDETKRLVVLAEKYNTKNIGEKVALNRKA